MDKQAFNFTQHLEFSAKLIGGSSFVFGTLLFLTALVKPFESLYLIGLYFMALTFVINAFLFLSLIVSASIFYNKRQILLKTAALLLFNIPVAFVYLLILINHSPHF